MRRLAPLLVAVALLAGCGGGTPAAPPAALTQALARVDAALGAHDWGRARTALDELVRRTVLAREAGEVSAEEADRILAAAARLAAGVPSPSPAPTATRTPSAAPEDDGDSDEHPGKGKGRGKGHDDD